jgi:hypothetical protein
MGQAGEATEAQGLLFDAFHRIRELVLSVTDGLDADASSWRPDPGANSVGWLVWHLARIQDDHIAEVADVRQAWVEKGWAERFGLPFPEADTGYGHGASDVAAVRSTGRLLADYHADVDALTAAFLAGLEPGDLERIVDQRWDPPVTLGVRLVSVIGDCLQHVGQAAYVRGVLSRRADAGAPSTTP